MTTTPPRQRPDPIGRPESAPILRTNNTPEQLAAARALIARRATGQADRDRLLAALGLDESPP